VRVVVLTTFELDEYVFGAWRAGAGGFLTKDVEAHDLRDATAAGLHRSGVHGRRAGAARFLPPRLLPPPGFRVRR